MIPYKNMYLNIVMEVVRAQRPSARMMPTAPMWWIPAVGGWVGGWVGDGEIGEIKAVRMCCCGGGRRWVGG